MKEICVYMISCEMPKKLFCINGTYVRFCKEYKRQEELKQKFHVRTGLERFLDKYPDYVVSLISEQKL